MLHSAAPLGGKQINVTRQAKYLRVILDSKLQWSGSLDTYGHSKLNPDMREFLRRKSTLGLVVYLISKYLTQQPKV